MIIFTIVFNLYSFAFYFKYGVQFGYLNEKGLDEKGLSSGGIASVLFDGKYYDIKKVPKELSNNTVYLNTINYYNFKREVEKIPHKDIFPWKNGQYEVTFTDLHKKGVVIGTLETVDHNDTELILTLTNAYLMGREMVIFF